MSGTVRKIFTPCPDREDGPGELTMERPVGETPPFVLSHPYRADACLLWGGHRLPGAGTKVGWGVPQIPLPWLKFVPNDTQPPLVQRGWDQRTFLSTSVCHVPFQGFSCSV